MYWFRLFGSLKLWWLMSSWSFKFISLLMKPFTVRFNKKIFVSDLIH